MGGEHDDYMSDDDYLYDDEDSHRYTRANTIDIMAGACAIALGMMLALMTSGADGAAVPLPPLRVSSELALSMPDTVPARFLRQRELSSDVVTMMLGNSICRKYDPTTAVTGLRSLQATI